ncbi:MAG: hypothetical protein LBQ98_04335 [Nitrososphaerota archaeon]|jgi:hypothetical protein|nr:hypothetical protein [Nitrososphaerota archaeon]
MEFSEVAYITKLRYLLVQQFSGHKFIENTELYIQLDKQLFQNISDDNFIIRAVYTIEEVTKLGSRL